MSLPSCCATRVKRYAIVVFLVPLAARLTPPPPPPQITCAVDLWALGIIIFQLLTGKVPFKADTDYLIFQQILSGDVPLDQIEDADGRDLVARLLHQMPAERIGCGDGGWETLKAHPFFAGVELRTEAGVPGWSPPVKAEEKAAEEKAAE